MRGIVTSIALTLGLCALSLPTEAQTTAGRALAANCFQCHGTDGRAVPGVPSIAGKDDVANKMIELKRKTNLRDIMVLQARAYTDAELRLMGDYFASVPEHAGAAMRQPRRVPRGAEALDVVPTKKGGRP